MGGVAALNASGWAVIGEPELYGLRTPAPEPRLDGPAVLSGAYQKDFVAYLGRALPLQPYAVQVKNQFYYTLLRQSGIESVVIGRHRQLYEPNYIDEYCSRVIANMTAPAELYATRLGGGCRRSMRPVGRRSCM